MHCHAGRIIIKLTKKLEKAIQFHNEAPQDKLQAIEHLRALITGNSAPITHQATEQQVEPPGKQHLEPAHIVELMAPVGDFDPPSINTQPIPVNNNVHSPEVLYHKKY